MRLRVVVSVALAGVLALHGGMAATRHRGVAHLVPKFAVKRPNRAGASVDPSVAPVAPSSFSALPAVRFTNQNSQQSAAVRLYDSAGYVDESEAARLDALLCDTRDPENWASATLDRRTLQLAVRAALHFHTTDVQVVSAYRKPGRRREGPHASGKAIDFKLPGVASRTLASYLRTLPRTGVGIYTHPKTGFVHLDDRLHSFHWLDASPPGRHWREMALRTAGLSQLDASYSLADDWPEGTTPPNDLPNSSRRSLDEPAIAPL